MFIYACVRACACMIDRKKYLKLEHALVKMNSAPQNNIALSPSGAGKGLFMQEKMQQNATADEACYQVYPRVYITKDIMIRQ